MIPIANLTRAGWSSKNNHLLLGEALSYEFEGKVLNPSGIEIDLPFWVFKRLKKLHLLERDHPTGMMRMQGQSLRRRHGDDQIRSPPDSKLKPLKGKDHD
jgi:hypothetical protein